LVNNPRYLLEAPPEHGLINPDNLLVLGGHLQAAAFELAFESGDSFGAAGVDTTGALLDLFRDDGLVHRSGSRYHWAADAFPAEAISLRRAAATNVVIIDTSTGAGGPGQGPQGPWAGSGGGRPGSDGRVIGEVDQFAAPVLVHDDAIYLHEGRQYHVERLDWEEKRAYVHPIDVDHYTLAETRTTLQILERYEGPVGDICRRSLGEVRVSRLATMYKKVRFLTHENVGAGPISLPEQDLHTISAWTAFDPERLPGIDRAQLDAGLSGVAAALHAAACLICMCDPRDLGSQAQMRAGPAPAGVLGTPTPQAHGAEEPPEFVAGWRPNSAQPGPPSEIGWPTVYVYDAVAGGVGFAERCHQQHSELVAMATTLVTSCGCEAGCPSCVGPSPTRVNAKAATLHLLRLAQRSATASYQQVVDNPGHNVTGA
ncbi:MAG TPA: Zn-binding domain-containing protein, partial [Candidatus Dormibacteraeota bacterium]|nr:Zn-binding domain-containing protein [Candidatus Dormibacteraeota bacterium]